jgi:4-amino-4-deoxy-L-arabinose transferase-like glycosyltransferase
MDQRRILDVLLITALWCAGAVFANPVGDFPLNDDWVYGLAVRHLLETGDYRPLDLATPTLLSNVLWGALFCLPTGFSFTALRVSTLVASWLGVLGAYVLVRDFQQPRWLALAIALTLAFNPVYFALSNTFMTDVPFIAIATWAAVFLARALRSGSVAQVASGAALALVATLSRNVALCIPLAFALTVILSSRPTARAVASAAAPLAVCAAGLVSWNHWLRLTGRMPALHDYQVNALVNELQHLERFVPKLLVNLSVAALYLGLFLSPALLMAIPSLRRLREKLALGVFALGLAVMAAGVLLRATALTHYIDGLSIPSPRMGNILHASGIGPLTLRDVSILKLDHVPALPMAVWGMATALGWIGSILLIAHLSAYFAGAAPKLWRRKLEGGDERARLFLLLCVAIYLAPVIAVAFFDRYLLPAMPFLAASLLTTQAQWPALEAAYVRRIRAVAFVWLATLGLFAWVITQDYLAWNRARWQALQLLTQKRGVSATEIDGGYEFNGFYLYDPSYKAAADRSDWWVARDTYQIAFGGVAGFYAIQTFPYWSALPPHSRSIVILRKD